MSRTSTRTSPHALTLASVYAQPRADTEASGDTDLTSSPFIRTGRRSFAEVIRTVWLYETGMLTAEEIARAKRITLRTFFVWRDRALKANGVEAERLRQHIGVCLADLN